MVWLSVKPSGLASCFFKNKQFNLKLWVVGLTLWFNIRSRFPVHSSERARHTSLARNANFEFFIVENQTKRKIVHFFVALAHKLEQFMTNSIEMNIQIPRKKQKKKLEEKKMCPQILAFSIFMFFPLPKLFKQMCLSSLLCPKSLRYNSVEFTWLHLQFFPHVYMWTQAYHLWRLRDECLLFSLSLSFFFFLLFFLQMPVGFCKLRIKYMFYVTMNVWCHPLIHIYAFIFTQK